MNSFIKSLPITSDMVSLWIPSGTDRAIDIIRGNHGQCYGTHPNVLVGSSLINTSLGWHFDGGDDYVDLSGTINAGTTHTLAFWVNSHDSTSGGKYLFDTASGRIIIGWGAGTAGKIGIYDGAWREFGNSPSVYTWHRVAFVLNGATSKMKMFLNGSQYGSELDYTLRSIEGTTMLGSNNVGSASFFDGYIALPFVANKAWSQAQATNDYLNTKSLFSPRG